MVIVPGVIKRRDLITKRIKCQRLDNVAQVLLLHASIWNLVFNLLRTSIALLSQHAVPIHLRRVLREHPITPSLISRLE